MCWSQCPILSGNLGVSAMIFPCLALSKTSDHQQSEVFGHFHGPSSNSPLWLWSLIFNDFIHSRSDLIHIAFGSHKVSMVKANRF
jgi:hypothetical protein